MIFTSMKITGNSGEITTPIIPMVIEQDSRGERVCDIYQLEQKAARNG